MNPTQPADVAHTPDGVRITLRPVGWGRYFAAVFLLVWIGGWAMGEAFAINMILAMSGSSVRAPFPWDIPRLPFEGPFLLMIGFMLFWLTFWTWGGLSAIGQVLKLLFGSDVILLAPEGARITRFIGPFGMTHDLAGWTPEVGRRNRPLIGRRDRKKKTITQLGTPMERMWVRDEILRRYPQVHAQPLQLPRDYESRRELDGTVVVQRTQRARKGAIGCGIFALLIWPVPFGFWVYYRGAGPGLVGGTIISLLFTALALWCFFARQTWRVKRDLLEERLEFFNLGKTWRFTAAALEIEYSTDSDGDERFALWVKDTAGRKRRLHSSLHDPEDTVAFAHFLQTQTGWTLHEPHELKA